MSIGYEVNKNILDEKVADSVLALRSAFDSVQTIAAWLANEPSSGTDALTLDPFGYTADEAYAIRIFFQTMDGVRTANETTFSTGRKFTGLE